MKYCGFVLCIVLLLQGTTLSQEVMLLKHDSIVFSQMQVIKGMVRNSDAQSGILVVNEEVYDFTIDESDSLFSVEIVLRDSISHIVAAIDAYNGIVFSDTLQLILGYRLRPILEIQIELNERDLMLAVHVVENPLKEPIEFEWHEDMRNAIFFNITGVQGANVQFTVPTDAPKGEYYFTVTGTTESGKTGFARTFITVDSNGITPFSIEEDYAAWIDSAIVYGITPYIFVRNGKFRDITNKIPEIAELGVNTLWLQPVYETYEGGQGYGITDYFKVRSDLGTEEELRELVQTAHAHGLRVLFDFVPNHSSIHHPFAQETIALGAASHYYDFYQREFDSAPYSQHYNYHPQGFVYYFWTDLPNLNYHNPEVRRWITEAAKYWVEEFDIDGYRIDAVWGVNARNPDFMQQWRSALKRIKPEVMLLGEDKASWSSTFDRRFDVAYDWAAGEAWVSQWVWQIHYSTTSNPTIFNNNQQNIRAQLLRNSLTNNGNGYHPRAKILRFLENNDTFRFIQHHGVERTKMAAALTYALHGIPLLYNGQEIGATLHPYSTLQIFNPSQTIRSQNQHGLFEYYQHLARIRKLFPAFYSNNFEEITVSPSTHVYGFRRWDGDQNIFGIINMGSSSVPVTVSIPVDELNLNESSTYYLSDLITGNYYEVTTEDLHAFSLTVDAYTTTVLILGEDIIITEIQRPHIAELPERYELYQNYPNPFNPSTTIRYTIPEGGRVSLIVYDLLGRVVETLVDEILSAGEHYLVFHASHLPSGTYLYRLITEKASVTRRMVLIK